MVVSIYSKLWKRIENGSGYQKKGESKESDGVCKKKYEKVQKEVEAALRKA